MNLENYIARYLPLIENEMQRVVDDLPDGPPDYALMLRYPLGWVDEDGEPEIDASMRGKRVRPALLLLCAEAAGGAEAAERALPAAAAVELLHNFSLIHDDIQDASETRRGRPTVWRLWGTAQAINAGDAMYTLAYQALYSLAGRGLPPARTLEAGRLFTETCLALTLGQHMDLAFETQRRVSLEDYLKMISAKSAALLAASTELGALVAGADAKTQKHYADFGRNLGLAFQIRDDILGIWGDERVTGKPSGADIRTRKKTLPVIYALEQSQALRDIYDEAPHSSPSLSPETVMQTMALIEETNARTYAENQESRAHSTALQALMHASPAPEPADALTELASKLLRRER